ncbi:hypothetical protein GIB67_008149 [Kingdonia uniflora]|uniref:Uncharacterized protein n=1 Tax=Kingdonia uniflora TaxID=39325 RepID=A0A7J7MTA9_9MAGN|nr:hypothetical protein GIB67_008149 [Kingdonia uniflora]
MPRKIEATKDDNVHGESSGREGDEEEYDEDDDEEEEEDDIKVEPELLGNDVIIETLNRDLKRAGEATVTSLDFVAYNDTAFNSNTISCYAKKPKPLGAPLEYSYLDTLLLNNDTCINKIFVEHELLRIRVSNKDTNLKGVAKEKNRQSKKRKKIVFGSSATPIDVDQLDEVRSNFQPRPSSKSKSAAGRMTSTYCYREDNYKEKRERDKPRSSSGVVEERLDVGSFSPATSLVDHRMEVPIQKDPEAILSQIDLCFRDQGMSRVLSIGQVSTRKLGEGSRAVELEQEVVDQDKTLMVAKRNAGAKAKEEELEGIHDWPMEVPKADHNMVVTEYEV